MSAAQVRQDQRHTRRNPCAICGGHADMPQGKGVRCAGFRSADGEYEHCQREQYAGLLALDETTTPPTYAHKLRGDCKCGVTHGPAPATLSPAARPARSLAPVETRYELRDASGRLMGVHGRRDYLDSVGQPYRKKVMWWERHDGRGADEMPLYNLAAHLAAPADALRIVCEGERAADALAAAIQRGGYADRVVALGTVTGAPAAPCDDSLGPLVDVPVALWPDNDAVGRQQMERIAARLVALHASAVPRWIVVPGAQPKADAADYFAALGTVERVLQLVTDTAPQRPANTVEQAAQADSVRDWQPTIQTASELMQKALPPVRWVVKEIIAEGVTLFAGKAKKGKSTMMLHVGMSVAQGTIALGKLDTEAGDVLYLALEDNERRMQRRIRKMLGPGENVAAGLHITYKWLRLDMGGSEALERYLDANPRTHLVMVDTLQHVRRIPRGNGNGYAEDYEACKELVRIAGERRIAIWVSTHLRKAPADDPFDEINATGGLLAGVDNALVMRPAGRDGLMELHRRGREFEDDSTLALRGDKATLRWSFAGQAEAVLRSAERQAIIDALPCEGAAEGMRPGEIADALGKPVGTVRKLLYSLMHEDEAAIARDDSGGYRALSNAGNAGNGNGRDASESAQEAGLGSALAVTAGVTALPGSVPYGNAPAPGLDGISGGSVTAVTSVTSSAEDGDELEAHL